VVKVTYNTAVKTEVSLINGRLVGIDDEGNTGYLPSIWHDKEYAQRVVDFFDDRFVCKLRPKHLDMNYEQREDYLACRAYLEDLQAYFLNPNGTPVPSLDRKVQFFRPLKWRIFQGYRA